MKWWRVAGGSGGSLLKRAAAAAAAGETSLPSQHRSIRNYQTIQAIPREHTGHKLAVKERAQGRVPAVVLDPLGQSSRKQILTADAKQVQSLLNSSPYACSTVFNLQVHAGPGSAAVLHSGTVLPIKVHKNEETGEVLNLVLAWADEGKEMKVLVPVVYKGLNVCPGLKKGGYLQKIRSGLKYLCPTEHIPKKIEVDLTNLDIGDKVLVHDIKLHPSLKLLSKNDTMPICKILATKPAEPEAKQSSPEATQTSEGTKA